MIDFKRRGFGYDNPLFDQFREVPVTSQPELHKYELNLHHGFCFDTENFPHL